MIDSVSNNKINTLDLAAINAAANSDQTKPADNDVILPPEKRVDEDGKGLPELPKSSTSVNTETLSAIALPSLGATVLALIGDTADEARRANVEARKAQTQAIVQTIQNQAEEMASQASTKLKLGIASGIIQVASGAASVGMTYSALKGGLDGAELNAVNSQIQGVSTAFGGIKNFIDARNEYESALHDVEIKKMDANIEEMRAYATQIDSLTDALKQIINKATSVQADIQANVNQTRTRILS